MARAPYLFDTNAVIEAVRTGVWNAITGALRVETVEECREECLRGDELSDGYIQVGRAELDRMTRVHAVSQAERAKVLLMERSDALHPGERDLFAFIVSHPPGPVWWLCSPDQGCIRFAVAHGLSDRLISLQRVADEVGARSAKPLRRQFTERWLSGKRTGALLENL